MRYRMVMLDEQNNRALNPDGNEGRVEGNSQQSSALNNEEEVVMNMTQHAQERFQQRGFDSICLNCLGYYGTFDHVPGGAMKISLPRKHKRQIIEDIRQTSKRIIQMIEKSSKRAVIVDGCENTAITLYVRR